LSEFNTAIDIASRACQHVGVPRIDPTLGFTEPSKQASEIGFVYGKLRRAELERNTWRPSIRHTVLRALDTGTMMLAASLWVESATYFVGSIVADDQGNLWYSRIPNNVGYQPQNTPAAWESYFGPLTVSLYDEDTTYWAGELVYTAAGDGLNRVYLSLQSSNADDPATATAWAATETYDKNQTVTRSSVAYQSLIDLNTNNDPALAPALWNTLTTYAALDEVGGSDGVIYQSLAGSNTGNDPVADAGVHWVSTGVLNPWTTVFVGGIGSLKWLQVGGAEFPSGVTLTTPNIVYPLGAGPASQDNTRNVYQLPSGYLKTAPQDPKAGAWSYLGAPSGLAYSDWDYEGGYIVSSSSTLIILRFVADITDVRSMGSMFCEGLAARIALSVCEPITQSRGKLNDITQIYQKFMGDARNANAIETGSVEPPVDDYLACRA